MQKDYKMLSKKTVRVIKFCKNNGIYQIVKKKFSSIYALNVILEYCETRYAIRKIISYLPIEYDIRFQKFVDLPKLELKWEKFAKDIIFEENLEKTNDKLLQYYHKLLNEAL